MPVVVLVHVEVGVGGRASRPCPDPQSNLCLVLEHIEDHDPAEAHGTCDCNRGVLVASASCGNGEDIRHNLGDPQDVADVMLVRGLCTCAPPDLLCSCISLPTSNASKGFMSRVLNPIWSGCSRRQNAPDSIQSTSVKISGTKVSAPLHDTVVAGTTNKSLPVFGAGLDEVQPIPIR